MLTIIFYAAVIWVTLKLLVLGVKAAWGITKILCTIILFPAFVVCLFLIGFVYVSLIILILGGMVSLLDRAFG